MNELNELAKKHRADKWGKHHYTPVYFELFKDRQSEIKKILEIGTAEGASLMMWNDFFLFARVFGADIDPNRVSLPLIYPRITITGCDQSNLDHLNQLMLLTGPDLDIVIDDGSHKPEHQVFTCKSLMPKLGKGVTYIIEDVADPKIILELSEYDTDMIKCSDRYDDRLIIVRHK